MATRTKDLEKELALPSYTGEFVEIAIDLVGRFGNLGGLDIDEFNKHLEQAVLLTASLDNLKTSELNLIKELMKVKQDTKDEYLRNESQRKIEALFEILGWSDLLIEAEPPDKQMESPEQKIDFERILNLVPNVTPEMIWTPISSDIGIKFGKIIPTSNVKNTNAENSTVTPEKTEPELIFDSEDDDDDDYDDTYDYYMDPK